MTIQLPDLVTLGSTDPLESLSGLCRRIAAHETHAWRGFHLTPSENVLSPLARLPFVLDAYSRYFLDDLRLFGRWFFPGGEDLGGAEQEVALPALRRLARAEHVSVHPISGINCMTVVFASLTEPGDTVYTVPLEVGGHASTPVVAGRFGLLVRSIPFRGPFDIDSSRFAAELAETRPALVYIDQSTLLFPIDPASVRAATEAASPETLIHYDSSHVNGLILGGALFNPLERGAHSFGGSTHKTLPGPHKGFFATNYVSLFDRFRGAADHFVSHHHMADVLSLAVTLLELELCGGTEYARLAVANARAFAAALATRGVQVAAGDRGYTDCHQVWAAPPEGTDISKLTARLRRCGLVVNSFNGLPGLPFPAFRLSLAEATRLGFLEPDACELADVFADELHERCDEGTTARRIERLRIRFDRPRYCFSTEEAAKAGLPATLMSFLAALDSAPDQAVCANQRFRSALR